MSHTYRWLKPDKAYIYTVTPAGLLVTWPGKDSGRPFSLQAYRPDGSTAWSWELDRSPSEIRSVLFSADGENIGVVEWSGPVHILTSGDGVFRTLAQLPSYPDGVGFTNKGRYLYVLRRTESSVYRYSVGLYPVGGKPEALYGATGYVVHVSPHHDLVLGITEDGIELETSQGSVGTVPYPFTQGNYEAEISADGTLILIQSRERGLEMYGRDLKQRWQLPLRPYEVWLFAPYAKVVWHRTAGGELTLLDADGQVRLRIMVPEGTYPQAVLPGGELLVRVEAEGRKGECVITLQAEVFGCAPYISRSHLQASQTGSFFWMADDLLVTAYQR